MTADEALQHPWLQELDESKHSLPPSDKRIPASRFSEIKQAIENKYVWIFPYIFVNSVLNNHLHSVKSPLFLCHDGPRFSLQTISRHDIPTRQLISGSAQTGAVCPGRIQNGTTFSRRHSTVARQHLVLLKSHKAVLPLWDKRCGSRAKWSPLAARPTCVGSMRD